MLKKCLRIVLCIFILLSLCLCSVNALACCDEQNTLVLHDNPAAQNDDSSECIFELNDLTAAVPYFHAAQKISSEHSSLYRKNPICDLYSIESQPDSRCELIFNRLCAKLNEIEFQRILKQNE